MIRPGLDFLVVVVQMVYMLVVPVIAWWWAGLIGLMIWGVATGVWLGASVVGWSAYQDYRSGKCGMVGFLIRLLLSPLLGTIWTLVISFLVVRYLLILVVRQRPVATTV